MSDSGVFCHQRISEEPKVLFVGLVCIDMVNICSTYPEEDSDTRVTRQEWRRGGNASNNSTVFSLLGLPCAFFGSIGNRNGKTFLIEDFAKYEIDISSCAFHDLQVNEQTVVIINSQNASRTILAPPKTLPSVTLEEFLKIDLDKNNFKWIHFEARRGTERVLQVKNILYYLSDMNQLRNRKERIVTSIELEKPEKEFDQLLCEPDYVFISKDYAKFQGYFSMEDAVKGIANFCPQSEAVICTWGEKGATCRCSNGVIYHSAATKLTNPKDTLGAGDTFTAGTIYYLLKGHSVEDAISFGCRLAGAKCTMNGFDGLKNFT